MEIMKKNQEFIVEIEDMSEEGAGIGKNIVRDFFFRLSHIVI